MSDPIGIICKKHLKRADISAFICHHGGMIYDVRNEVGQVDAAGGTVWFFFNEIERERIVIEDLIGEEILDRFAGPYGSSVTLEVSSAPGSAALVQDLAIAGCALWAPAFVYDWMETVFSLEEMIRLRAEGRTFLDVSNEKTNWIDLDKML